MLINYLLFRSKINNNLSSDKTESSDIKTLRLLTTSNNNKIQQHFKSISNDKNKIQHLSLTNSKIVERFRSVHMF